MSIKEALLAYFKKLEALYMKEFGTLPTISWSQELDQSLFVGTPDEDGEIQWRVAEADFHILEGLSEELQEFFGSFYFWNLSGNYQRVNFYFQPVSSQKEMLKIVTTAISEGKYYFPDRNIVLLAFCNNAGNDDLLLFYDQDKSHLFMYDTDKRFVLTVEFSLAELLGTMEAII